MNFNNLGQLQKSRRTAREERSLESVHPRGAKNVTGDTLPSPVVFLERGQQYLTFWATQFLSLVLNHAAGAGQQP